MKNKTHKNDPGAAVMDAPAPVYSEAIEEKKKDGSPLKYALAMVGYIWVQLATLVGKFKTADLKPNPNNPRGPKPDTSDLHGPVTRPLLVTADGRIVQGHRRYAHARMIGLETVPALVLPKDTPEDAITQLAADHGGEKGLRRVELARSISYLIKNGHSEKAVFTLLREALNELNPMDKRDATDEYKRHRGFIQQVQRLDTLRATNCGDIAVEYEKNWAGETGARITAADIRAATSEAGKEEPEKVREELRAKLAGTVPTMTDEEKEEQKKRDRLSRLIGAAFLVIMVGKPTVTPATVTAREMARVILAAEKATQPDTAAAALDEAISGGGWTPAADRKPTPAAPVKKTANRAKVKTAKK